MYALTKVQDRVMLFLGSKGQTGPGHLTASCLCCVRESKVHICTHLPVSSDGKGYSPQSLCRVRGERSEVRLFQVQCNRQWIGEHIHSPGTPASVCVCVCVRKKERERERELKTVGTPSVSLQCVCVFVYD